MRRALWVSILLVGAAFIVAFPVAIDFITNRNEFVNLKPISLMLIVILVVLAIVFAVGSALWTVNVQKVEVKAEAEKVAKETTVKFENKIIDSVNRLLELSIKQLGANGEIRATIYTLALDKSHLRTLTEYNMNTAENEKFRYAINEPIVGTVWSRKQFDPIIVDVFEKKPSGTFFISKEKFEIIKNEGIYTMLYVGIPTHNRQDIVGVLSVDSTLPPKKSNLLEKSVQDGIVGLASELGLFIEIGSE